MALVVKDRVRETSTSTGTGTIILNGAVSGFQGFSVIGDGNTTYYTIVDAATGAWEVGIGTYTLAGATLSRDSVLESSNAGNKVDFAAGTKDVFCTYPAERSVYVEGSTITPAVAATLPVVSGGTGATSLTGYVKGTGTSPLTASATIPNTDVSGLGTMSTQNANNVAITGGTIDNTAIGGTTPAAGAFTSVTASLPSVISVNSTSAALRITQVGSGNALLVEDSANPDVSPFVVDTNGQVIINYTSAISSGVISANPIVQMQGLTNNTTGLGITNWSSTNGRTGSINFNRSNGNAVNTRGALTVSGTSIGMISFTGDDGTSWLEASRISSEVDGTPGTNDMPGRLVFSTTADGASSPAERMRINSAGNVGIGGVPPAGRAFNVLSNATGSVSSYGVNVQRQIQSDVTSNYFGVRTQTTTAASSFTLGAAIGFFADQGTIGAGSTVTNQFGFNAGSTLIGATNNYGFYSDIASGTGRWNFYAAGSAANYFAGATTFNSSVTINGPLTVADPVVQQSDVGTAPNQVPLNQYLGNLAFQNSNQLVINPVASVVPAGIGDMVFQLTNDTTLVVKVKGSDGTVRSATLTLA